jgi:hypothetical protein
MTSPIDPVDYQRRVFDWARERGIKTVRLAIYQPKVTEGPTFDVLPLHELETFARDLQLGIERCLRADAARDQMPEDAWNQEFLVAEPTEDVCRWCKAYPSCPAVQTKIQRAMGVGFEAVLEEATALAAENLTTLQVSEALQVVPLIEGWCKAVRARMESHLLAGGDDDTWGLELGRKGNRQWADPEVAEDTIRNKFRIPIQSAYTMKLKSPTQIEELTKPAKDEKGVEMKPIVGPRQWKLLQANIVRKDGVPSVKRKNVIKDPYVVIKPDTEGLTPVEAEDDDLAD